MAANAPTVETSRRKLLFGGAVATVAGVLGIAKVAAPMELDAPPLSDGVIFPDPALCVGCLGCEVACSDYHASVGLSAVPRIRIMVEKGQPVGARIARGTNAGYLPSPCKQCPDPECFVVCPTDALKIDDKMGARFIEESACVACGKCAESCPYPEEGTWLTTGQAWHSPRIFYDAERNVYTKCDLCRTRAEGPACVSACPVNASIRAGKIQSDHLCLDVRRADVQTYKQIR